MIKEELSPPEKKKKAAAIIFIGGRIYELKFEPMNVEETFWKLTALGKEMKRIS
jgi:hypothetical protein